MKKRIVPLLMVVLLVMAITVPTASAVSSRVISGRPTLRISGDIAYFEAIFRSGNRDNDISVTLTLNYGTETVGSWSATGKGSVTISESKAVSAKGSYTLILKATVNSVVQPEVVVTAEKK